MNKRNQLKYHCYFFTLTLKQIQQTREELSHESKHKNIH